MVHGRFSVYCKSEKKNNNKDLFAIQDTSVSTRVITGNKQRDAKPKVTQYIILCTTTSVQP